MAVIMEDTARDDDEADGADYGDAYDADHGDAYDDDHGDAYDEHHHGDANDADHHHDVQGHLQSPLFQLSSLGWCQAVSSVAST